MDEKILKEIIEFYKIAGKLKTVERTGWISVFKMQNPESVADHTFGTAVLAMVISDLKGLDTEKMIRMALIHDLHESIMGDWDSLKKEKFGEDKFREKEKESIGKILRLVPEKLKDKYSKLWDEFVEGKSEEAKLIEEIEKLELAFQTLEYEKDVNDEENLKKFWDFVEVRLKDEDLKRIFELLKKKRVK